MKNFILICVIIISTSFNSLPQWLPLDTGGISNYFINCYFISADIGWVVGVGPAILKTTNGGNTWIYQQTTANENPLSVYFLDEMNGWVSGFNGSIYKTDDGGDSWTLKPSGTNYAIREIEFIDSLVGFAIVSNWIEPRYGAIIKTTNGGDTWVTKVTIYDYAFLDLDFIDTQYGWAAGTNGVFYRTTNGGENWIGPQFITDFWIHEIDFPSKDIGYAIGGGNSDEIILKTTNAGLTWSVIRQSQSNSQLFGSSFVDINKGWVVGMNGTILYTQNGGISWLRQETNVSSLFHDVIMIDTTGYAVGELGKIYKYDQNIIIPTPLQLLQPNGGEVWEMGSNQTIIWNSLNISSVKIEFSLNDGLSWNTIENSYPSPGFYNWEVPNVGSNFCRMKITNFNNPDEFAISDSAFSILEPSGILDQIDNQIPDEFYLLQNYPNPFNPSTTINFGLKEAASVTLKIYDINGQLIATLLDEYIIPGNYSLSFDAGNLSSGTYFCRIQAGSFIDTKKMIFLK